MIRANWAISIVVLVVGASRVNAQGNLQHVRDDVRSSSSSADSNSGSSSGDTPLGSFVNGLFSADDGEGGPSLGLVLTGVVALAPFYLPASLLNDRYEFSMYFAPHPYAGSYRGYQLLSADLAAMFYDDAANDVARKNWAVRVALENGNDFDGLIRLAGQLKIEHSSRWGIVSNWNYYREPLSCGCIDETVIGDTNVTFRFAQNEVASFYSGLGVRMLSDRRQTDFGFNFTYGGDWFPVRPLVVSAVFDAGTLGNAGVIHSRGSIGAIWHGWEVFGGYDFLRIGSTNLQGPMAGVRWWF